MSIGLRIEGAFLRVDHFAAGVQIHGRDMERLVQIADKVNQEHQGFLPRGDIEWRRSRLALKHRDGGIDGVNYVMIVGAKVRGAVVAMLNGNVRKMEGLVTLHIFTVV